MPYILDFKFKIKHRFEGANKFVISILRLKADKSTVPPYDRSLFSSNRDIAWELEISEPGFIQKLFKVTFESLIEDAIDKAKKALEGMQKESDFRACEYRKRISFSTEIINKKMPGIEVDNSDVASLEYVRKL